MRALSQPLAARPALRLLAGFLVDVEHARGLAALSMIDLANHGIGDDIDIARFATAGGRSTVVDWKFALIAQPRPQSVA